MIYYINMLQYAISYYDILYIIMLNNRINNNNK